MKVGLGVSLRKILGKQYIPYLQEVILPEIESALERGDIRPHDVGKVEQLVAKKGIDVLEPQVIVRDDVTRNTLDANGYILQARLPLTDTIAINNIIKKFSSGEDFDWAVELQRRVYAHMKAQGDGRIVPKPQYANRKQRILVTPFVSGKTLKEKLDSCEGECDKEVILKGTIADYFRMFNALNEGGAREELDFPAALRPFEEVFTKFYLGEETGEGARLRELYKKEFAEDLDAGSTRIVHGDFHPGNMIVRASPEVAVYCYSHGESVYLDWANAASNGLAEMDIGKKLMKADIGLDLEERLVEFAALEASDDGKEQEAFRRRYMKNAITENLCASRRYLERADRVESEEGKEKLRAMAKVLYNTALQKIRWANDPSLRKVRRAGNEEIVSKEFLEEVLAHPPGRNGYRLSEVDDLEDLKKRNNPHIFMSQLNVERATPLTELVEVDAVKSLKKIRRSLRWEGMKRKIKMGAFALFGAAALTLGGLGLVSYSELSSNQEYNKQMQEKLQEKFKREELLRRVRDNNVRSYRVVFISSYAKTMQRTLDEEIETKFTVGGPIVEDVAKEFEFDPLLLRTMLKVNRYYAGIDSNIRKNQRISGINLLDPFRADLYKGAIKEPVKNLQEGAKKLAQLRERYGGDMDLAMLEYYTPFHGQKMWRGSTVTHKFMDLVRGEARKVAYNAIHGMNIEWMGGASLIYFKEVPKDFPSLPEVADP